MEGEINNLIVDWLTIVASLCYCHTMGKLIPKGTSRLFAILPIVCLFLLLPLNLTTVHLTGFTSFFVAWIANFKLLAFAYGKGPLSPNPPLPLFHFIFMACLPVESVNNHSNNVINTKKKGRNHKSPLNYTIKILLLCVLLKVYEYNRYFNYPKLIRTFLYVVHTYLTIDMGLAVGATLARAILVQVELKPQFDEPYLSTSVQEFWGKRWNLMVSSTLRTTVYDPVRSISTRLVMIPRKYVSLPAVFATFFVSGVVHELIFYYYMGLDEPTWEITSFFLINGVWVCMEIVIKKELNIKHDRLHPNPIVSWCITFGFLAPTFLWLFFPAYSRFNPDVRACKETVAFMEFVKHRRLVSPNDVSCPYF